MYSDRASWEHTLCGICRLHLSLLAFVSRSSMCCVWHMADCRHVCLHAGLQVGAALRSSCNHEEYLAHTHMLVYDRRGQQAAGGHAAVAGGGACSFLQPGRGESAAAYSDRFPGGDTHSLTRSCAQISLTQFSHADHLNMIYSMSSATAAAYAVFHFTHYECQPTPVLPLSPLPNKSS